MGRGGRREQHHCACDKESKDTVRVGCAGLEDSDSNWRQDEKTTSKEGKAALVAFIPQFHSHFCKKVAAPCCLRGDHVAK